jgi:hypothetical protein
VEVEEQPQLPVTAERLEAEVERALLGAEVAACMQLLQQEISALAQNTILKRLAPAGGVEHPGALDKALRTHQERLRILKEIRMELEEQKPLVTGAGLELVSRELIIPGVTPPSVADAV